MKHCRKKKKKGGGGGGTFKYFPVSADFSCHDFVGVTDSQEGEKDKDACEREGEWEIVGDTGSRGAAVRSKIV